MSNIVGSRLINKMHGYFFLSPPLSIAHYSYQPLDSQLVHLYMYQPKFLT